MNTFYDNPAAKAQALSQGLLSALGALEHSLRLSLGERPHALQQNAGHQAIAHEEMSSNY